jgi:predicted acetyltransferase
MNQERMDSAMTPKPLDEREAMKFASMVDPNVGLKDSFIAALRSMRAENPAKGVSSRDRMWGRPNLKMIGGKEIDVNDPDQLEPNFEEYVRSLNEMVDPAGRKIFHWGVDANGEYLGYLGLWSELPPERQNVNGHITLELRPSARGADLGNAEAMMEWAYAQEKEWGVDEVMFTCSPDNKGTLGLIHRLEVKGYALREVPGVFNEEQKKQKLKFYQETIKS